MTTDAGNTPVRFSWRGRVWDVTAVTGRWAQDDGDWWQRATGTLAVAQIGLWRVEATPDDGAAPIVAELSHRPGGWELDRVWD